MMATVADILQKDIPAGEGIDSYSLLPLFKARNKHEYSRPFTIHHSSEGFFAIRKEQWKLIMTGNSGGGLIPSKPELINGIEAPIQLYDLKQDPLEQKNVYLDYPEKVEELKKLLLESQQKK
jgi:arylsulfatase A